MTFEESDEEFVVDANYQQYYQEPPAGYDYQQAAYPEPQYADVYAYDEPHSQTSAAVKSRAASLAVAE